MKTFTAILAIGSLLSVALASPLQDINFEETALYTADDLKLTDHQVEARQISGLPPVAIPTKPADVVPSLQTVLVRVKAILAIARQPSSIILDNF